MDARVRPDGFQAFGGDVMADIILENLIRDAELVAEVGNELDRIRDVNLFQSIARARSAVDSHSIDPQTVVSLHQALRIALAEILPVTMVDLRQGWRPFREDRTFRWSTLLFAAFSLVLLITTSYMTQVYHKAGVLYETTVALQNDKGSEQAIRLYDMLKKNQGSLIGALKGSNDDTLREAFYKALYDLESLNSKNSSYYQTANESLAELSLGRKIMETVTNPVNVASSFFADNDPVGVEKSYYDLANQGKYGPVGTEHVPIAAAPLDRVTSSANISTLDSDISDHIAEMRNVVAKLGVGIDPLAPVDYSLYLFSFQQGLSLFGLWILPGLYGTLGAVIFLMRRILDPSLPSPTWLRFPFRILLGGFAGIIVVWLIGPDITSTVQPKFASLGLFGVAFIVGYSTDMLFLMLDRIVNYFTQTVGKIGA